MTLMLHTNVFDNQKRKIEEEDIEESANEEATQEEAKQIFLSKENEDETKLIEKLIRKQEVIVDLKDKGTTKEQKVGNKDQATNIWMESGQRPE